MHYLSKSNLKKWRGKTCLLRIDLNDGIFRLETILPTIKLLRNHGIKIIILSHRGRPIIKKRELKRRGRGLTLRPFVKILGLKLQKNIKFIPFSNDFDKISKTVKSSENQLFLLENLRFWPEERQNKPIFARKLAFLGDFYVNEAFGVSHRQNASISAITRFLPSCAGLRFELEIKQLKKIMKSPKRPFTIILGGAKIEEKMTVIHHLFNKADYFLIGSATKKHEVQGANKGISKILFPVNVKNGKDIGPRTIKKYSEIIKKSKTIIWNGPVGEFEKKQFAKGTIAVWKAILANRKAKIIVGGGETVTSLKLLQSTNYKLPTNEFLSTGGGAMLYYLSGKKLPGIAALENRRTRKTLKINP